MSFIKIGDALPISGFNDGDKEVICDKCKKPKLIVVLENNENKLVCDCELETKLD